MRLFLTVVAAILTGAIVIEAPKIYKFARNYREERRCNEFRKTEDAVLALALRKEGGYELYRKYNDSTLRKPLQRMDAPHIRQAAKARLAELKRQLEQLPDNNSIA